MAVSLRAIAEETGLSRSAVQTALETVRYRELLRTARTHSIAVPAHRVLRPWDLQEIRVIRVIRG